jgi:hypothetical protein
VTIARRNGVKDYEEPVFNEENIVYIENADDVIERINPSGPVSPEGSEDPSQEVEVRAGTQFNHLNLPTNRETNNPGMPQRTEVGKTVLDRKTRYLTAMGQQQTLTKRESVAIMHERVTGLRDTSHLFLANIDRTQSIALDEIFGKK